MEFKGARNIFSGKEEGWLVIGEEIGKFHVKVANSPNLKKKWGLDHFSLVPQISKMYQLYAKHLIWADC